MMVHLGGFLFRYRDGLFPLAFILLFLSSPPVFADHWVAAAVGFVVALAGQSCRSATMGFDYIKRGGKAQPGGKGRQVHAETLVQGGLFAHSRNPLYLGNLTIIFGLGLAANSWLFLLFGVPLFVLAYRAIIAAEEQFLRQKFGQEFENYCARVNRLFLNPIGLGRTLHGLEFNWQRMIIQEYGSTYAWLAGILVLVMKNHWQCRGYADGHVAILTLGGSLVAVTLAYGSVRYLKKARILLAE